MANPLSTRNPFDITVFSRQEYFTADPVVGGNGGPATPTNVRSELINLSFQLITDANVADRVIELWLLAGANTHVIGSSGFAHVASTQILYTCNQSPTSHFMTPFRYASIGLARIPFILPSDEIHIRIINKQATDRISGQFSIWKTWSSIE